MCPETPVNSMIEENSMPESIRKDTLLTSEGYNNAENAEDTSKFELDK